MTEIVLNVLTVPAIAAGFVGALLAYVHRTQKRDEAWKARGIESKFSGRIRRLEPYAKYWWILVGVWFVGHGAIVLISEALQI